MMVEGLYLSRIFLIYSVVSPVEPDDEFQHDPSRRRQSYFFLWKIIHQWFGWVPLEWKTRV